MAFISSKNILAKDIIAEARELVGIEEARLSLASVGRIFYNMAISDIYTLLLYIDVESLLDSITLTVPFDSSYQLDSDNPYTEIDLSTIIEVGIYDKISTLEMENYHVAVPPSTELGDKYLLESFELPLKEFLRHKSRYDKGTSITSPTRQLGAGHPYNEAVVFTLSGNKLLILYGENVAIALPINGFGDSVLGKLYYTRQPILLTITNYDTAMIDVPDKYYSLLVNRIAAYAELRSGITDKAVVLSQNSMNQIIAPLEPQLRAKIMDSFQLKPTFTPNEDGGKLNYGK